MIKFYVKCDNYSNFFHYTVSEAFTITLGESANNMLKRYKPVPPTTDKLPDAFNMNIVLLNKMKSYPMG
jgi:hypothetical protein